MTIFLRKDIDAKKKFEGFIMERLQVDTIDASFIKNFILFGKKEEYRENTIYKSIHFIRTILNFAERKGIRTAVRELQIRREKQHKEVLTLTEQEITLIKQAPLNPLLQPAREWLIISCYTGQRVSDFMEFSTQLLTPINGKTCISFIQKKTKKKNDTPPASRGYTGIGKNNGNFPQKINPALYNQHIKQIARSAGLIQSIKTKKEPHTGHRKCRSKSGKPSQAISEEEALLHYSMGKFQPHLLMQATGHTSENMFLKYINPLDHNRILGLSGYFEKIYHEKNNVSLAYR